STQADGRPSRDGRTRGHRPTPPLPTSDGARSRRRYASSRRVASRTTGPIPAPRRLRPVERGSGQRGRGSGRACRPGPSHDAARRGASADRTEGMCAVRTIDRSRLSELMDRELARFRERHPRSRGLSEDAKASLLFGVPMNWMTRWPGDHPVYVDRAEGAHFWDVDGNAFVDFCLGDTGGMAGHRPKGALDAIAEPAG